MAFNATKNRAEFERARNWCAGMMNLWEESQRIRGIDAIEASPGGVDDPAFVDVPDIATKAALKSLIGIMGEFNLFMAGGGTLTNSVRKDFMVPFVDQTPAGQR